MNGFLWEVIGSCVGTLLALFIGWLYLVSPLPLPTLAWLWSR